MRHLFSLAEQGHAHIQYIFILNAFSTLVKKVAAFLNATSPANYLPKDWLKSYYKINCNATLPLDAKGEEKLVAVNGVAAELGEPKPNLKPEESFPVEFDNDGPNLNPAAKYYPYKY